MFAKKKTKDNGCLTTAKAIENNINLQNRDCEKKEFKLEESGIINNELLGNRILNRYFFVRSIINQLDDNDTVKPVIYNFLDISCRSDNDKCFFLHKNVSKAMFDNIERTFALKAANEFLIKPLENDDDNSVFYKDFLKVRKEKFLKSKLIEKMANLFDCDIESSCLN